MSADESSDAFAAGRLDGIETQWSLLRRSSGMTSGDAAAARQLLVLRYAKAIRGYSRALVGNDEGADELSQDVVVRLLQGDFAGADPDRGRFRDLLRTAIRNMARNRWAKSATRQASPLLDDHRADDADDDNDPWLDQWRDTLLDNTWQELRTSQEKTPGSWLYAVLRARTDHPDESSEALAERLSNEWKRPINAASVRQNLKRARTRFCELLVNELREGLDHPTRERLQDELIAIGLWSLVKDALPEGWGT